MKPFFKNRVFVVEQSAALRDALAFLINGSERLAVAGVSPSLSFNLSELHNKNFDILLIDISNVKIEVVQEVSHKFPLIKVMIYTDCRESEIVFQSIRAGATGYILREDIKKLIFGLEDLAKGGAPMSRSIARMIVESHHLSHVSPLTKRETEILNLLSKGQTSVKISESLEIAKDTAKRHIFNIYQKLKVNSKAEAIRKGVKQKLIAAK